MFGSIILIMIFGFITGGLARLAVPGPDPMPAWLTVFRVPRERRDRFSRKLRCPPMRDGWELTMLTALILICSAAVTPDLRDCTRDNATAVMRVSSAGNGAALERDGSPAVAVGERGGQSQHETTHGGDDLDADRDVAVGV